MFFRLRHDTRDQTKKVNEKSKIRIILLILIFLSNQNLIYLMQSSDINLCHRLLNEAKFHLFPSLTPTLQPLLSLSSFWQQLQAHCSSSPPATDGNFCQIPLWEN